MFRGFRGFRVWGLSGVVGFGLGLCLGFFGFKGLGLRGFCLGVFRFRGFGVLGFRGPRV